MKKTALVALCLCGAIAASAQLSTVKDAEKKFKDGDDYAKWEGTLKTALANTEPAQQADAYMIPAKKGFQNYDALFTQLQAGVQIDNKNAGLSLVKAYEYGVKAMAADSLPNAKGQVKPKHSKDVVSRVASHYRGFDLAGRLLYNSKDWADAIEAWDIYFSLPQSPVFGKTVKADPDSLLAENRYLQAFCATQLDDYARALDILDAARAYNFHKPEIYTQGMYVAKMAQNPDKMVEFAEEGFKLFGTKNPLFFRVAVEGKLQTKKYDEAKKMLDQALASDPNNATFNSTMGSLKEEERDIENALKYYRIAAQNDPTNGDHFYNIGRMLVEQGDAIAESMGSNVSENQFHSVEMQQINPLRAEAAKAFEKAYELNENTSALNYLKRIYYVLHDDANLKRVEDMLKY